MKIPIHCSYDELVPIKSIKLWKENPRNNDKAVPHLARLIKQHGIRSALTCWKDNRVIYKGNTTYKALKALGVKEVPILWQPFKSEVAAVAYGISDNKSNEFSEWNDDVLLDLMQAKKLETEHTGFRESELFKIANKSRTIVPDSETRLPKLMVLYHPSLEGEIKKYLEKVLYTRYKNKVVVK